MAETKRVLILAVRFGSGHWQAALALKKALLKAYPAIEVEVVNYLVFAGFLFDKITRLTYHDLMIRVPPIYRRFFSYTDQMHPESLFPRFIKTCGVPAFRRYLRRETPDLIISTFTVPSAVVSRLKQRGLVNCPLVTVVTDYVLHQQWIQPDTDLYLVANSVVAGELVRRGVPRERVAATGIPIDPRFEKRTARQVAPAVAGSVRGAVFTAPGPGAQWRHQLWWGAGARSVTCWPTCGSLWWRRCWACAFPACA